MIRCCLVFLLLSFSAHAEIYKWVDDEGNMHFSDQPPLNQKTEQVEVRINTYESVDIATVDGVLSSNDKVTLYTTAWCGVCKKAKQYFQENNIAFTEYDVEKTRKGRRDFKTLKGKGVPIILYKDKRMNGFTIEKFDGFYAE